MHLNSYHDISSQVLPLSDQLPQRRKPNVSCKEERIACEVSVLLGRLAKITPEVETNLHSHPMSSWNQPRFRAPGNHFGVSKFGDSWTMLNCWVVEAYQAYQSTQSGNGPVSVLKASTDLSDSAMDSSNMFWGLVISP